MNNYYVYVYLRKSDNTPYYIGKGTKDRAFTNHDRVSIPKDKSKIVFWQTGLTNEDACKLEISYIKLFGRKDLGTGILLNMTNGGEGCPGRIWSEKSRNKLSIDRMGELNPMWGFIPTDEQRKAISLRMSGENHHMFGKKHKKSSLELMSEANKRRIKNNDHPLKNQPRVKCPHCDIISTLGVMKKHHFDNCKWINGYVPPLKIEKEPEVLVCPYCFKSGTGNLMYFWHFDNCKKKVIRNA